VYDLLLTSRYDLSLHDGCLSVVQVPMMIRRLHELKDAKETNTADTQFRQNHQIIDVRPFKNIGHDNASTNGLASSPAPPPGMSIINGN